MAALELTKYCNGIMSFTDIYLTRILSTLKIFYITENIFLQTNHFSNTRQKHTFSKNNIFTFAAITRYGLEVKEIIHEAMNVFHFYSDYILLYIYTQILQRTKIHVAHITDEK